MELKSLQPSDAAALAQLDALCFTIPWSEQSFLEEAANEKAHYCLAYEQGHLIGYGGFWAVLGEGDITNIAVHPDFRRKGIASAIVQALLNDAAACGVDSLMLEVRASNRAAIALYEKFGFQPVGRRKGYYSDNQEDAILMKREEPQGRTR